MRLGHQCYPNRAPYGIKPLSLNRRSGLIIASLGDKQNFPRSGYAFVLEPTRGGFSALTRQIPVVTPVSAEKLIAFLKFDDEKPALTQGLRARILGNVLPVL